MTNCFCGSCNGMVVAKMFTKLEFFGAIARTALIAFGAGYSKAREICMEVLAKALSNKSENEIKTEEES